MANSTDEAAERQRRIQSRQDQTDRAERSASQGLQEPFQAGARRQPTELGEQHQAKPGNEAALEPRPNFDAPDYRGSGKLAGEVAFITGGDSGIGRSVAILFAREGADVALGYLGRAEEEDALETQRCVLAEGRRCLLLPGDVKDPVFCNRAVAAVVEAFGRLDVLVNNAAFQEHAYSIESITDERFEETMMTNIGGYFRMARAAVPHLPRGGCILNSGSVTGLEGSARLLDYAASKGAIHAFTKSLASQLLPKGIRVNAVAPGPVWTPLNPADVPGEQAARLGQHTDLKRAAQPEEIAPAYVFLASPVTAGYITGIVLPITGSVGAI